MAWDVRQTYYYLVCFATLLMVIIGAAQSVRAGLDLALPEEPFRPTALDLRERVLRPGGAPGDSTFTRAELEAMADEEQARLERQMRRNALRRLLGSLALVVIAAPVYAYHWRQVRRT
ncbi:MAG: hypothetical protein R3247_14800 [Rhodothermales bacterium]|nr:hypothetical protein [Rhodothermales bacterium]